MFERCLYFNLNALVRKVDKVWEGAFASLGLSPAHAYLLRLVLSQPSLTQKAIAEELHLEKSTVTRFITALAKKGYVRRTRAGREQHIAPTTAARRLEAQLNERGDALYAKMTKTLGATEMLELVRCIRETSDKLS